MLMGPDTHIAEGVERPLEARLRSVAYAAMAYWYYEWDWGEAIAYDGLDVAGRRLEDPGIRTFVEAGVRRWSESAQAGTSPSPMGPVSCAARRAYRANWEHLQPTLEAYLTAVRNAPRTSAGSFLLNHPGTAVFVDSIYSEPVALAEIGYRQGDHELFGLAVDLCLGHCRLLQDDRSGLFRHYHDTHNGDSPPILWGRGNGWALLGLADLLTRVAPSTSGFEEVRHRFIHACEGLAACEVPGGGWRNLMDDPASTPEASTTAMATAALYIGVGAGVLEAGRYHPVAERGWNAIQHRVDANGHVVGVSFRPGINRDPARYEHVPLAGSYPWGQGAYLRAAAAWLEANEAPRGRDGP